MKSRRIERITTKHHEVSAPGDLHREFDRLLLDGRCGINLPQAGRVDGPHDQPCKVQRYSDVIAGGARYVRDDRNRSACQRVHKRALADIRRPNDRDRRRVDHPPQHPISNRIRDNPREIALTRTPHPTIFPVLTRGVHPRIMLPEKHVNRERARSVRERRQRPSINL